jgi:hypothetical protein
MIFALLAILFIVIPVVAPRYGVDSRPSGDWRRLTD